MQKRRPFSVSVCMATFNGRNFIEEQLNSILNQLTDQDELVISDDHSTDGTWEFLQERQEVDSRIKLFSNQQNGVISNFENAILHSQNEIIFLSDQDDVWQENKIDVVLDVFDKRSDISVVVSDLVIVDNHLATLIPSYQQFRHTKSGFWRNLLRSSYIGAGMAFKTTLKPLILPIPKEVPMHDMWIGLLADRKKQVAFIPDPLVFYRRHELNVSEIKTTSSRLQQLKWRWNAYHQVKKREREFRKNL